MVENDIEGNTFIKKTTKAKAITTKKQNDKTTINTLLTSLHLFHLLHVLCKAASWFQESENSVIT